MDTKTIRAYFLTSQEDLRQEDFELTAEPGIFELAEQVESELVDDYVIGRLSSADQKLFESQYLVTEARRAKVAEAQMLVRAAAEFGEEARLGANTSWFGWVSANKFALPTAVTVLIAAAFFAYVALRREAPTEIAKIEPPVRIEPVEEIVLPAPTAPTDVSKPANSDSGKTSKKFTPATISLSPRNFRNRGREIVILKDDTCVPFLIKLEAEPGARVFSNYSVRIETPEGVLIPSSTTIVNKNKAAITVSVAANFEAGSYIIYLTGFNRDSELEPVGEYAFRVVEREPVR